MSEHIPTTAQVRELFAAALIPSDGDVSVPLGEFDRWLAEHDREVQARAFDAAAVRVRANFATHGERCSWVGFLDDEAARLRTPDSGVGGGS